MSRGSGNFDHEAGSSRAKRTRTNLTAEAMMMPRTHHAFLEWPGCIPQVRTRYNNRLAPLLARQIHVPHVMNMELFKELGCDDDIEEMLTIRVRENMEEKFQSIAWLRALQIQERIYAELCKEFYATFEFNENCAKEELRTKKIIEFRLGGKDHKLTLLEFARRLGLYDREELLEEGFNDYFDNGLRSDEEFNASEFWRTIGDGSPLVLSRTSTTRIRYPLLRVIQKLITYGLFQRVNGHDKVQKHDLWYLSMFHYKHERGYANVAWAIAMWMKKKGAGSSQVSWICGGQFVTMLARRCKVLNENVINTLSAPSYCRFVDKVTLRELITSENTLIAAVSDDEEQVEEEEHRPPPRRSMQDLYQRMGSLEIRQEGLEHVAYRQGYIMDRYQGVFEHMAGVYNIPLQGAYNPPPYAQPQFDNYYAQYPSHTYAPFYAQQQPQNDDDDDE